MIELVSENIILYIDEETKLEYKHGKVIIFNSDNKTIFHLYKDGLKKALCKIHFLERLFRLKPRYAMKISNSLFLLSYNKGLYILDIKCKKMELYYNYAKGTNNPLHFSKYSREGSEEIVFADYGGHDDEGNVGIYRIRIHNNVLNASVEEFSSIDGEGIDHIHRVEYDEFRDCYWIFSGDKDSGSCIWKMDYQGRKIEKFLYGKQFFRSCVAFIYKDKMIYLTDSPNNENYLVEVDIESKKYRIIQKINGSCIYGGKLQCSKNTYYFSTAVEPCTEMSRIRYIFTYKLGKGIKDKCAYLYVGNEKGFQTVYKAKKDFLPMLLFQFGNIVFPEQYRENYVYFYLQSCKSKKSTTLRVSLEEGD